MRIIFCPIVYPVSGGMSGVAFSIQKTAEHLAYRGHRVSVVVFDNTRMKRHPERHNGVDVIYGRSSSLHYWISRSILLRVLARAVRQLEYSYALNRIIEVEAKRGTIDVLQVTETGGLLVALRKRRLCGCLVMRLHGEKYTASKYVDEQNWAIRLGQWLERKLQIVGIRNSDCLVSPTIAHANEVSREAGAALEYFVLPNVVREFPQEAIEDKIPIGAEYGWKNVLIVGRIEEEKGSRDVLEIAEYTRGSSIRFSFAGDGSDQYIKDLKTETDRRKLRDRIQFLGTLDALDLASQYSRTDIVMVPSRYESFGNVFIEAMKFSKPYVSYDIPSIREIDRNEAAGLQCAIGSVRDMADAIMKLAYTEELYRIKSKGCQELIRKYSDEELLPVYEDFYSSITAFRNPRSDFPERRDDEGDRGCKERR